MTKQELSKLLHSIDVPVNEGISSDKNRNKFPRIVYFEYVWEEQHASDSSYETVVTYQVSFFSRRPRDPKLLELRKALHEVGQRPVIYHEYVDSDNHFHSYFAIDVLEDLDNA